MMDRQDHREVTFLTRALELRGSVTLVDIVAYRGFIRSEKECSRVYWIMGKLHNKNEGPNQEIIKL